MSKVLAIFMLLTISQIVNAMKTYYTNIKYIESKVIIYICEKDICATNQFTADIWITTVENKNTYSLFYIKKGKTRVIHPGSTTIPILSICPRNYMVVNEHDHSLWDGTLPYICESLGG